MRRLASMLAGVVLIATVFAVGFSGSSVTPIPKIPAPAVSSSGGGGATFEAPFRLAVVPLLPALAEVATTAPETAGCRPLTPLEAPCPEPPPGMVAGALAGLDRWRPLVAEYFEADDVELALSVIGCESHGDPGAANPSSSARGLFQHLASLWPERAAQAGHPGADILDPRANIAVAAWLVYHGGGWSHWNASGHCW
jgi:hypothetical protein